MPSGKRPAGRVLRLPVICLLVAVASCHRESDDSREQDTRRAIPAPDAVETREDGLAYLTGSAVAHTGLVLKTGPGGQPVHLAHYQDGKLHGPDIRWHENRRVKRIHDYEHGEKTRHREWFETGTPKIDAMMRDGVAYGRHVRWHPDGRLRFEGNFVENMQWDGRVRDFAEDGSVIVDAEFDRGRYVTGTVPPDFPTGEETKTAD